MSGSDVVEGIRDGKLERGPLAGLLDLAFVDVTPGSVVGEFAPVAWMANPLGAVQGGVLISAVDAITGLSAQTLTRVDQDYRVLDHKIDFLRSPDIGGPVLRAEASVIRAGRRLALIETRIVDAGGTVVVGTSRTRAPIERALDLSIEEDEEEDDEEDEDEDDDEEDDEPKKKKGKKSKK